MDKNIEMLKLQIAAAHYESALQTNMATAAGFAIGVTIFLVGLGLELLRLGYSLYYCLSMVVVLYAAAGFVIYCFPLRNGINGYNKSMMTLDGYIRDVENGNAVPPLKDLLK